MTHSFVASTWKRAFALWIDGLISGIFLLPLWLPFIKAFFYRDEAAFLSWPLLVTCVVARLAWDIACLSLLGATPGKLIFGLRVISINREGGKLSFSQAVIRVLADQLSFFFGIAPRALAFARLDRRHLSDWLAETQVVQHQPREKAPERRMILLCLLILSGVFGRMAEVYRLCSMLDFSTSGVSAVHQER